MSLVEYMGDMYMFGGRATSLKTLYADLWKYSFDNGEWTDLSLKQVVVDDSVTNSTLSGVYGHTAVVHEGKMYVFGGYSETKGAPINDVSVYDFSTGVWSASKCAVCLPEGSERYGHTALVNGDIMYMFGGMGGGFEAFSDVWAYDIPTQRWSSVTSGVPVPVYNGGLYEHAASIVRGNMMFFGGQGQGSYFNTLMGIPVPQSSSS